MYAAQGQLRDLDHANELDQQGRALILKAEELRARALHTQAHSPIAVGALAVYIGLPYLVGAPLQCSMVYAQARARGSRASRNYAFRGTCLGEY